VCSRLAQRPSLARDMLPALQHPLVEVEHADEAAGEAASGAADGADAQPPPSSSWQGNGADVDMWGRHVKCQTAPGNIGDPVLAVGWCASVWRLSWWGWVMRPVERVRSVSELELERLNARL
jgi:hypothetical protein